MIGKDESQVYRVSQKKGIGATVEGSITISWHPLCLEIVFFLGHFLLTLTTKQDQVKSMGKFGHRALNFD